MLRAMRDGAKTGILKFILMGFLVLAGGGLVLTDVGGFFRGGVSATDVANVGNLTISAREFDRNIRNVLARQGITPSEAYQSGLMDSVLRNEVNTRLLTIGTHDMGLKVSDEEVARQIRSMTEDFANTETNPKLVIQSMLRQQGISEGEFIDSIRQQTVNTLLTDSIRSAANFVPEPLAQTLYAYENESRTVNVITLTNNSVRDIVEPTDESLQSFYEANKFFYLIPEHRTITIATLNTDMLEDRVEITEEELQQAYDSAIETFQQPQQRSLEQAIVTDASDAEAILAQANEGKSLKNAVTNVTGSGSAYQASSDFEKSGLLEDIADPVFAATKGDVIGPIETPLGFHVIKVTNIIAPETTPFAEVRDDLRHNILQDRLIDEMIDAANAIDDRLAGGETLETVVSEMGLTTEKIGPFKESGMKMDSDDDALKSYESDRDDIIAAAYDFEEGDIAPVMELSDGRFVAIRIDSVKPREYKSLDSVKADLKKRWIDQQKALTNKARAQDALTSIQEGQDFKDAAQKLGAVTRTYKNLKRQDPGQSNIPAGALDQIFNVKAGQTLLTPVENGFALVQVTDIITPDIADAKEEDREQIMQALVRVVPNEIFNQYLNGMNQKEKVKVNRRLLDQMYGSSESQAF